MKSVTIIGQFPPPMHGLSKALDTLWKSELQNEFKMDRVDLTNNKNIIKNIFKLINSNSELYYFTISQSKFGNLRDLVILKLLQTKKRKIVIHLHGGGLRKLIDEEISIWQKNLNYKVLAKIDAAIVLGDSLKYIFKDIVPKEKILIVPNCIDDEFMLSKNEIKEKIAKNEYKTRILYLSNFIKSKGYFEVLKIAKEIKQKGLEKYEFIFAGKFFSKEEENEFFDFIKENSLERMIKYEGIVYGEKKRQLLNDSDIFILLSTYPKEGQPISIIEAMGTGNVVISTNHAGIPDLLENTQQELILDRVDIDVALEKIIELNNNKEYRKNKIRENYKSVECNYKESKYIENIKNIWSEI